MCTRPYRHISGREEDVCITEFSFQTCFNRLFYSPRYTAQMQTSFSMHSSCSQSFLSQKARHIAEANCPHVISDFSQATNTVSNESHGLQFSAFAALMKGPLCNIKGKQDTEEAQLILPRELCAYQQ